MDGDDDCCEDVMVGQIERDITSLVEYLDSMDRLDETEMRDGESEDLIEMRSNVIELIELKREQLLECKKALLLERCEDKMRESDCIDLSVGAIGSIEYRYNNGRAGRRNVSIVASKGDSDVTYRGFLCHPMDRSEVPCRHEIRGIDSCDRGSACRYSHGLPLLPEDIGPPLDTSDCPLSPGDQCLCLTSDSDLWRPCRLLFIDPDADSFIVELVAFLSDKSERVIAVTRDRLVRDAPLDPSDDSDRDPGSDTDADLSIIVGGDTRLTVGTSSRFGEWEQHTRGIGMKLLLKMGYTPNTGLGKHGQGRLNPIEVKIKPTKRKKPEKIVTKNLVERNRSSASVTENIKSSLARNEGELYGLQAKIESLERSKERHSGCRILTGTADKKIGAIRHRIGELKTADKILAKKLSLEQKKTNCDKPKKLKIF